MNGGVAAAISTVFEDLWHRRTQLPQRSALRSGLCNVQAWLARFGAEVKHEKKPGGGQLEGTTVTPADWQGGKHLDEHLDDDLDLDADRLPMQSPISNERDRSRSPALVARGGAEGGASQNNNEKNGE